MLSLGFSSTPPKINSLPTFPQQKPFAAAAASIPLSTHDHAQQLSKTNYHSNVYTRISLPRLLGKALSDQSASNQPAGKFEEEEEEAKIEEKLPKGLRAELMPKHVGLIMDGNRRWAVERGWTSKLGHIAGQKAITRLVGLCSAWGIKVLTVFAFSTENWIRHKQEVRFLMKFFEDSLKEDIPQLGGNDVRVSVIGDRTMLSDSLREVINEVEENTKANSKVHLIMALNYSGKYDIVQACKGIAEKVKRGVIQSEDIQNDGVFELELETKVTEFPCPDLLIRTSGEFRISNFMLWQLAYSELFFVETMFPDFGEAEFVEVLSSFQKRQGHY